MKRKDIQKRNAESSIPAIGINQGTIPVISVGSIQVQIVTITQGL